mmetsp:Transcript_27063/g.81952  ORF Transcript_27063/g.81952 Transcript_27063/m.81952 type:complete len:252 (-) Transcript_27063:1236-1991(-)
MHLLGYVDHPPRGVEARSHGNGTPRIEAFALCRCMLSPKGLSAQRPRLPCASPHVCSACVSLRALVRAPTASRGASHPSPTNRHHANNQRDYTEKCSQAPTSAAFPCVLAVRATPWHAIHDPRSKLCSPLRQGRVDLSRPRLAAQSAKLEVRWTSSLRARIRAHELRLMLLCPPHPHMWLPQDQHEPGRIVTYHQPPLVASGACDRLAGCRRPQRPSEQWKTLVPYSLPGIVLRRRKSTSDDTQLYCAHLL